ncbi:lipoprotein [Formosa agariphila KMM 3901]|uniref:Lipoprotein n=1 Tax=Formosa agariphila (strain DSM 15362 / KCTC 12365 / LMG 23005 / KMM 3901 / M-2Alg 35-1) TaxID=1347342 RepID=T2KJ77_FORAG|nr:thioredoxin-like domain-containing protein [Formosa agariphila]CDF78820.1 lipoprotein [Formosa agariphila KMM 3901]
MKHLYLIILLSVCFTACKKDAKHGNESCAFLGGEIINPSNRFVVITQDNNVIDTVNLDQENRFLFKINPVNSGLYTFSHGGEIQMIFLEPNDSIIFRLNNLDFDESLVFTGRGAKENNYLMKMFLQNEEINPVILRYSQASPKVFKHKVDSIKAVFQEDLDDFTAKYKTSERFNHIAQANIDYNFYAQKELYPFTYYGNNELKNLQSLPKDFYNYRANIDYNDEDLKDYFPYFTFLKYHFNNIALQKHFSHSNDSIFNNKSLDYNLDKIQLIDSLVSNDSIKNSLLNFAALRYINSSNRIEDYTPYLESYLEKSTSVKYNNQIESLIKSIKKLSPGNKLPNTLVLNNKNEELYLSDFIKRPTAIYFWSFSFKKHFLDSHQKAHELMKKYPEVDFIAMNIDKGENEWINYLNQYQYPLKNEYHFKNPELSRQMLALNSINRVMLLNKDLTIVNSNTNMFSKDFEEQLLGMINQ